MRILIATSTPFHLVHLARELAELEHEVMIISYMPAWKLKKYNLGKAKYKSVFWYCPPLFLLALQHIFPNFQRKLVFKIMNFTDFLISKNLEECDVFIGLSGVNVKSFLLSKKKYNAITICERGSAHVLSQKKLITQQGKQTLPNQYIEREIAGYHLADYITIPSIFSKNTFIQNNVPIEKLFVNNYGVDLLRFNSINKLQKKRIDKRINALFVGGWSYQKGVDLLEEALEIDDNLHITHIGNNGGYAFPKNKRFISLGHINNKELVSYYLKYDFLILPSRQDGFGMVLLEALSCGLPIVASKNTGVLDIYEKIQNKNAVEIISKLNSLSILESIKNIVANNDFKKTIFTQVDKEKFTWKSYAKRYEHFLQEINK